MIPNLEYKKITPELFIAKDEVGVWLSCWEDGGTEATFIADDELLPLMKALVDHWNPQPLADGGIIMDSDRMDFLDAASERLEMDGVRLIATMIPYKPEEGEDPMTLREAIDLVLRNPDRVQKAMDHIERRKQRVRVAPNVGPFAWPFQSEPT